MSHGSRRIAARLSCAASFVALTTVASGCGDSPADSPATTSTGGGTSTSTPAGGGGAGGADGVTRPFDMGFTPWPWDATLAAVDWTWDHLASDGDLVSQHIEEGVPWPEAASGAPFPQSYLDQIADRKAHAAGKRQLLSLNALDISRTHLAPFRTEQPNTPLTAPWSDYALDDPEVEGAYLSYVQRMVDLLEPDFVQTGIEVNLLRRDTDAATWATLVSLQCHVYQGLKALGYTQPISVSLVSTAFYHPELYDQSPDLDAQLAALHDLEPCVDLVAWSVYPYISGLLADSMPDDYFGTILALTTKPQGISESGYLAQQWSLPNVATWNGTPEKQRHFVDVMLSAASAHDLRFVVWFAIRDYDQLWERPTSEGGLGSDSLSLIWRDTGLYDEAGAPRVAWDEWSAAFELPHAPR